MDPWAIVTSLGVKQFSFINDPFYQEGNKTCGFFFKVPFTGHDLDDPLLPKLSTIELKERFEAKSKEHTCIHCRYVLPSSHLLDLHISEMHDSFFNVQAEKKPMYKCLLEECRMSFNNEEIRKDHCVSIHKFPSDFRFSLSWRTIKSNNLPKKLKHNRSKNKKTRVNKMDIEDSESFDMDKNRTKNDRKICCTLNENNNNNLLAECQMDIVDNKNTKNQRRKKSKGKRDTIKHMDSPENFENKKPSEIFEECEMELEGNDEISSIHDLQSFKIKTALNGKTKNPRSNKMLNKNSSLDNSNDMEISEPTKSKPRKIPQSICFGYGTAKGFIRPNKTRHWHQKSQTSESKVNIENVNMSEIADALDI